MAGLTVVTRFLDSRVRGNDTYGDNLYCQKGGWWAEPTYALDDY